MIIRKITLFFLSLIIISVCVNPGCKGFFKKSQSIQSDKEIISQELKKSERQIHRYGFDPASSVISRIKTPPDFVMKYIREMDGREYTPYLPDKKELKIIRRAIKLLPALHKRIIKERVLGIYFINDFWGSGMTDWVLDKDGRVYTTLFFNPITLKMNMSEWLTYKEKTCFFMDGKDYDIAIKCGTKYSGFLGILLHEGVHVVDYVKNITPFTYLYMI